MSNMTVGQRLLGMLHGQGNPQATPEQRPAQAEKKPKETGEERPRIDTKKVWSEYDEGITYKESIGLYETVEKNERFYVGNQWEGVNAPDLDKPIFNILRRVVTYAISQIVSDDVTAQAEAYASSEEVYTQNENTLRYINAELGRVIEETAATIINRDALRNAAVDGDAAVHVHWDKDAETGQAAMGAIQLELIDNTSIIFGNPAKSDVQKQPYILLPMRMHIRDARRMARENRVDPDLVQPDSDDTRQPNADKLTGTQYVTVVVRYWRESGTVWCCHAARDVMLREPWDTGLKLYPVAWFSWERVKNSYHGQAAVSGMIPNQIAINKLFALYMKSVRDTAFPKILYDESKITGWSSDPGKALAVTGDPSKAVYFTSQKLAETSGQPASVVEQIMALTKDTMGASDAALGNVRPNNTSAIIAVQKAASAPLELQRMAFYAMIEAYVRIMLDMMRCYYGTRRIRIVQSGGQAAYASVDFAQLNRLHITLKVNVGQAAYWSELTMIQTLDNLFTKGLIPDPVVYLESIPDGYIPNKANLVESLKASQEQAQMMQMQAAQAQQMQPEGADLGTRSSQSVMASLEAM